jgi:hypothetical protein
MHYKFRSELASSVLRAVRLALARALYTLFVAAVALTTVGLVSALTASSITGQECRPLSGLTGCPPLAEMFGLDMAASLVRAAWRTPDP